MDIQNSLPVVIGGVGGSGTRLIAELLKQLGFFIGTDLNEANDNLWFTLLFKRLEALSISDAEFDLLVDVFVKSMTGGGIYTNEQVELIKLLSLKDRPMHNEAWLKLRAKSLLLQNESTGNAKRWGWKEPNTHVLIERLAPRFSGFKYIHVMRNGLDMAFSNNQNQLRLWGRRFLNQEVEMSPFFSLKYWCATHKRVIQFGDSVGSDFLLINYDEFCANPKNGISRLIEFLEVSPQQDYVNNLYKHINPPSSIGRFRQYSLDMFDVEDVEYVKSLGFAIN